MFTARMFHSAVSWIAHECQMVTISVDYRRPPEHPFPTPLLDVYYTVLWAQLNAQKLGFYTLLLQQLVNHYRMYVQTYYASYSLFQNLNNLFNKY